MCFRVIFARYYSWLTVSKRKSSRHPNILNNVSCRTEYFNNSFFPSVFDGWNNLNPDICDSRSYGIFRKSLLKFIRPVARKTYHINDSLKIKLLTRLKLSFSHLHKHRFRHNFKDTLNPLCSCNIELETTEHFFQRCQFHNESQVTLWPGKYWSISFYTKWNEPCRFTIIWWWKKEE